MFISTKNKPRKITVMRLEASSAKEKENTIFTYVLKLSGTEIGSTSRLLKWIIESSGIIVAVLACLILLPPLLRKCLAIKKNRKKIDYDRIGEDFGAASRQQPWPTKTAYEQKGIFQRV